MTVVVLATVRMLEFLDGGGHSWVYLQYAEGLRRQGCDVYVLDAFTGRHAAEPDPESVDGFRERLAAHGLRDKVIILVDGGDARSRPRYVGAPREYVSDLISRADILLNFNYRLDRAVVSAFRRSALIDIDPGLLQYWLSRHLLAPARHDAYLTTGEKVCADAGFHWLPIRPPVCLEAWPYTYRPQASTFTTVSSWWGHKEYVGTQQGYFDNNKRASYLKFVDLPAHTDQPLELALYLGDADEPDRELLQGRGWRVRHSREVAATPAAYQHYIQASRGEFSCAKPSCQYFQNGWVSDRSLCYLASGKPVVAQYTGPSAYLPEGEGLFRFRTMADAVRALDAINADYERQSRLARQLAEQHFDAKEVTRGILERTL